MLRNNVLLDETRSCDFKIGKGDRRVSVVVEVGSAWEEGPLIGVGCDKIALFWCCHFVCEEDCDFRAML